MEQIINWYNSLGETKLFIWIFPAFIIFGIISFVINNHNQKAKIAEFLKENPNAVKLYIKNVASIMSLTINIISIDDEPTVTFSEGIKTGVYITPGEHTIEASWTTNRPGVMYRNVSKTYGPVKKSVKIEGQKNYTLYYNSKEKDLSIKEV